MAHLNIEPLNYEGLKQYGLQYLKQITHGHWTDFSVSDPGVTFLEALCFALADLGYRTSLPIADLMTKAGENTPNLEGPLFPAHEILCGSPTTLEDYRKFILENIPGIRNVEIETCTKPSYNGTKVSGFYRLYLEMENGMDGEEVQRYFRRDITGKYVTGYKELSHDYIMHYVRNQLLKYRNVCEDFAETTIVNPVQVGLCMELVLDDSIQSEKQLHECQIAQQIYNLMDQYISPCLPYYTIPELLEKGKTPAEIYQCKPPRLGFIDADELANYHRKTIIRRSDVAALILTIPGIKGIKHLHFVVDDKWIKNHTIDKDENHVILLNPKEYHFSFSPHFYESGNLPMGDVLNEVVFFRDWFPFTLSKEEAEIGHNRRQLPVNLDVKLPNIKSRYRNTNKYQSFQELLPQAYRQSREWAGKLRDKQENADKFQLKAYLTFFDQLLADYLAQLDSVQQFFMTKTSKEIDPTYFYMALSDQEVCDVEMVIKEQKTGYAENDEIALERKNRVLNHLLARFNDSFACYAALGFALRGKSEDDTFNLKENIEDKKRFLRQYPTISGKRAQGHDYTETWAPSGLEQRIMARLGLNSAASRIQLAPKELKSIVRPDGTIVRKFKDNRSKSFEKTFGLHVFEHIALVPYYGVDEDLFLPLYEDDDTDVLVDDPYSFQVTVLLPGWLYISQNLYFRQYIEQVIREEIPSHVIAKICWVSPQVMADFEKAYGEYLVTMHDCNHPHYTKEWCAKQKASIYNLVEVAKQFRNIYPLAQLDGDILQNEKEGHVKLDFSNLEEDINWTEYFTTEK